MTADWRLWRNSHRCAEQREAHEKYQPADQLCLCTGENARLCAENTSSLHLEQDHQKEIQRCLKKMAENMSNEYILTESIARQLHSNINMRLSEMNRIFLMLNINFYNRDIRSQDTVGIILSHGYSTASSIADAANSLLNSHTFEAIDMPLNTPVQEISGKPNDFIEENPHLKNIILLVDMGSLEESAR
ncbi:MAG: hypothetical protein ACLTJG_16915 [[Clostridium] innocuum]